MNPHTYANIIRHTLFLYIQFQISELPLNIISLCKKLGIRVVSYKNAYDLICALGLNDISERNEAFYAEISDSKFILFDDYLKEPSDIRFAVAHELGHIVLSHDMKWTETASGTPRKRKSFAETEADCFALHLLAPLCLLRNLGITTAADIAQRCLIPYTQAKLQENKIFTFESPDFIQDYENDVVSLFKQND